MKIIQVLTFNLKKNHLLEDTPALPLSGWMTSFIDGPLCIIILIIQKYGNFQVSISLGHFIKHKPLICEELFHLLTFLHTLFCGVFQDILPIQNFLIYCNEFLLPI